MSLPYPPRLPPYTHRLVQPPHFQQIFAPHILPPPHL